MFRTNKQTNTNEAKAPGNVYGWILCVAVCVYCLQELLLLNYNVVGVMIIVSALSVHSRVMCEE